MSQEDNKSGKNSILSSFSGSSYFWALVFALVIAAWMLSGFVQRSVTKANSDSSEEKQVAKTKKKGKEPFLVEVQTFTSSERQASLILRGRTEVDARVAIKAELAGVVELAPLKKGKWVKKGELLCGLEIGERDAALLQAKASLAQAEADYKANSALARKGHTAELRVTSFKAKLDAAKAELKKAELNLARTKLKAPFDGFVEGQPAKVGDFLNTGSTCATLVALDPLTIVGTVSELEVVNLSVGMSAFIKLVSGEIRKGKIRFISSSANRETRTFRIEVEIANKNGVLRDGLTADIKIPLKKSTAHRFSPAVLVLNDNGLIGVRTVSKDGEVKFIPVTLLSDSQEGVWVAGLPDTVRVITTGQAYVKQGQKVRVTEKKKADTKTADQGS